MYSTARVDQFEMKDMCFGFVIHVSWQGNNVKINKICRDFSPTFFVK